MRNSELSYLAVVWVVARASSQLSGERSNKQFPTVSAEGATQHPRCEYAAPSHPVCVWAPSQIDTAATVSPHSEPQALNSKPETPNPQTASPYKP